VGHYQPETVCDLQALIARATACGIDSNALSQALDGYYRRSVIRTNDGQDPTRWQYGMYAVVVLLVQRSAQLIGSPGRSVEVLPYVVRYQISANKPLEQNSSVHPAFHVHALSPALLAMTSGFAAAVTLKQVVILGGGSLGSKVGLHLGRAGCGNVTFVDKESMSPHNLARHALLQLHIDGVPQHKGHRMKAAFEELSHRRTRAFDADVVQVLTDPAQFKAVIPEEATVIVEATASLKVLAAETISSPLNGSAARLVRIAMFGQGRCAFMLLEAPGRLCRVDDLTAALFEHCRFDARLRAQIIGENTDSTRVFVGDNCRSLTSPMSDSTVSRAASLVGLQLERWLVDGMPEEDRLCVGMADTTGIGMSWESVTLGPTRVLDVAEDGGWQVRVLHPVVQAIDRDVRQWLPKETGGALLGRISYQTRTITIAGMIDPPIDSIRERARFVLGTKDLIGSLRDANRDSVGHLAFVGTWHSHPNGGQHSGIDRETLRHIAEDAGGLPAVSLVWTPTGLTCAVERW
jgi:integrative and conjugative element protein (TIGR02256 family)